MDSSLRANDWFLRRLLELLVKKHRETIFFQRCIKKDRLYKNLSWWFRCSRSSTREVLRLLVQRYPGIRFSNRGLHVPVDYLDPKAWTVAPPSLPEASPVAGGAERSGPQAAAGASVGPLGPASVGSEAPQSPSSSAKDFRDEKS